MLSARNAVKQKIRSIALHVGDYMRDPRIGPGLLLGACISFGTVWLKSSQTNQPTKRVRDQLKLLYGAYFSYEHFC